MVGSLQRYSLVIVCFLAHMILVWSMLSSINVSRKLQSSCARNRKGSCKMLDAATESASSGIVTGTDRLLIIEGLTNTFDGVRYQLNGVDLTVCKGQKLGLVGINGCGKSTMLRIIGGKENSDKGNIETARNTRVVYVEQEPYFPPDITVMDAIYASDAPLMNILRDYQEASEAMAAYPNDKDAASRFEKSMALMEKEDAWDAEGRAHRIMQRLRVDKLKSQQVNRLSGGEKKRVALASALVQQPEVLLLDEPTNHLDMEAIDWLGDLLADKSLTFLLVTHDRWFLENVCQEILELDNGKIYRYPGSYGKYLEAKEERLRVEEQEYSNDKNKLRHEIEWVRKQPKARQAKSKSRVEAFFRLKSKVNSSNAANPMGGVTLQNYSARLGSFVLKFTDANLSFSKRILDDFSYEFHKGDRIGIVGANGVGKSTFLNVLTQQQMLDSGVVTVGETVRYGYYQQQGLINVNEEQRVLQLVEDVCAGVPKSPDDFAPKDPQTTARQLLKRFNFPASRWNDMVSRLSGGEKRRLQLLKILASSPNFLVLDEPTNDLDIPTLSVLEEFLLTEYKGCLIIVSHDRFFMERVAKKLFLFEGDGEILAFEGLFSDYLGHIRSVLKERERDEIADTSMAASMSNSTPMSNSTSNKSKLTYKQKKDYEGLEKEIEKCSKRQKELSELLNGSYKNGVDYVEVAKWSAEFSDLEKKINDKTEKWMEIAELVDG